jgi:hypothetical protein
MVSTRNGGGKHRSPYFCLLFLISPKTLSDSRASQFLAWKDLVLYNFCLLPWSSWPQPLGLIFKAKELQMGETNFLQEVKCRAG